MVKEKIYFKDGSFLDQGKLSVKINRWICEIKKKSTVYGMVCLLSYSQQICESW